MMVDIIYVKGKLSYILSFQSWRLFLLHSCWLLPLSSIPL